VSRSSPLSWLKGSNNTLAPHSVDVIESFVLEGLFGEADVEAIDTKPDSELITGSMGMEIEDNTADIGMIIDMDAPANWFVSPVTPFIFELARSVPGKERIYCFST
jgi:hypothetical protein